MRSRVKNQTVAFIGDCKEMKLKIKDLLESQNFNFEAFDDSSSFFKVFFHSQSDVVIIYAQVFNKSLLELINLVKEIEEQTRIIIITDNPSERLELRVRGQGIAYFAIWPEDQNYLKDVINAALVSRTRERFSGQKNGSYQKSKGLLHEFSIC